MAEENRFAHLLAPIRDLSANWHTDIAAELSDYLAQLEDITFSFDGGNTALNFAEGARRCGGARARRASRPSRALILKSALLRAAAALLIQGSTCVYSRKVEYLHKLVYNALEAVASKRRARPLSLSSPARWPAARCC
jgi:condensin-2 complex subunit H2